MEILGRYKFKEIVTLRVDPGECLQASLEKFIKYEGGNALVLTAVGSISKIVYANPKPNVSKINIEVDEKEIQGPFELVSLIGGVGPIHAHGKGDSHLHIAVSKHDGSLIGGGLRYGTEPWFPVQVQLLFQE